MPTSKCVRRPSTQAQIIARYSLYIIAICTGYLLPLPHIQFYFKKFANKSIIDDNRDMLFQGIILL